jgi:hypothetical protein
MISLISCQSKDKELSKNKIDYPKFFIENNLIEQFDRTKWELYKINCTSRRNGKVDYIVNFPENDSIFKEKYSEMREEYGYNTYLFYQNIKNAKELFGEENVEKYISCDLEFFGDTDTTKTNINDRRSITFFPRPISKEHKYFQKPVHGYAYTIGFQEDTMTFVGFDDYYEMNFYDINKSTFTDEKFIEMLDTTENVNEWLVDYANKLKKTKFDK